MITMDSQFETAKVYHDTNSLAQLKAKGKNDSPEAIREAAKQFESIFMGMMLKSMRDANAAIIDEPMLDSAQLGMYQDMHDEQLSLHLSSSKSGLGLTDVLVEQLSGVRSVPRSNNNISQAVTDKEQSTTQLIDRTDFMSARPVSLGFNQPQNISKSQPVDTFATIQQAAHSPRIVDKQPAVQLEKTDNERGLDFSSASNFVASLWPYAKQAAEFLNLNPKVLIAQAALETGWGKHVMRTEQGTSSKNLFGIKASGEWQGEKVSVTTLELDDGALSRKSAEFRAYSFKDYTKFISDKNRYSKAREVAADPAQYAQELQSAGYATDPNYASKIGSILNSPTLNNALKLFVDTP